MNDYLARAKQFLLGRKASYCRTFTLESLDAQAVLIDLARFCRAHTSTAHADTHIAARLDGRREVWLRIAHHLKLDDDTLWLLYSGQQQKDS